MGNKLAIQQCSPFDWQEQFEIIDSNIHDGFLSIRSRNTREEYIGKEIISTSASQTNLMETLIAAKLNRKNTYLTKLVWAHHNKDLSYCSYQTKYYLAFQKYALNLKEEKIQRQFRGEGFSEQEVNEIVRAVTEGLLYLKGIGQPHQRVCLQNIYLREDRTVMLGDPWLFSKEYTSIYTFHLNGFIYPSPEKILYQNDMIDGYDLYLSDYYSLGVLALELIHQEQMDIIYQKGFRKILEDNITKLIAKVQDPLLRQKLKVLLSYDPQQRQLIQKIQREGLRQKTQSREKSVTQHIPGELYAKACQQPIINHLARHQNERDSSNMQLQARGYPRNEQFSAAVQPNYYKVLPQRVQFQSRGYEYNGQSFVLPPSENAKPRIVFNNGVNLINSFPNINQSYHRDSTTVQSNRAGSGVSSQVQKLEVPGVKVLPRNGPSVLNSFTSFGSKQPINESKRQTGQILSNVSIEEEINRIISSLRNGNPNNISRKQTRQNTPKQQEKLPQLSGNNSRNWSQSEKKHPLEPAASEKYHYSVNSSYNNMTVNNSFTEDYNREEGKQPQGEGEYSFRQLKHLTSLGQVFKETQSVNSSFQDRSDNMSVVIGHRFSSKDSSLFSNFRPEVSLESRVSMPERSPKELLTIQERCNSENEQALLSKASEDEVKTDQSHPEEIKAEVLQQTPEHRPCSKRYNSTIKQVSEEQPSLDQVQNDLQERVIQYELGTKYVGQTKNGKRYGKGLFYYSDGSYYEGQWKDNKMHGRGCLYYSNGSIAYQGGWYMDTFHGRGRIYNDQPAPLSTQFDYRHMTNDLIDEYWYSYEGDFFFEQKHGRGKLKLSNGEAYIGEFSEDRVSGKGKFYKLNGEVVQGKWTNGELSDQVV